MMNKHVRKSNFVYFTSHVYIAKIVVKIAKIVNITLLVLTSKVALFETFWLLRNIYLVIIFCFVNKKT